MAACCLHLNGTALPHGILIGTICKHSSHCYSSFQVKSNFSQNGFSEIADSTKSCQAKSKCRPLWVVSVCPSTWACETYIVHHDRGTELPCEPLSCIVHHQSLLYRDRTVVHITAWLPNINTNVEYSPKTTSREFLIIDTRQLLKNY